MKTDLVKIIKVSTILLILLSACTLPNFAFAGVFANLSFAGAPNPPDVTEGVEPNTTVFYSINNSDPQAASAQDTTFTVVFDNSKITFDGAGVDPTPFDNCSAVGNTVTCSCLTTCSGVFDNSSDVPIGLPFFLNDGSVTPTPQGIYNFAATLTNPNIVVSPIMTTKTLNVLAPPPPDPDVVINMQLGPEFFQLGKLGLGASQSSLVTYKIAVDAIGIGASPATNVVITHMIPAGLTFDSFSNIVGPNLVGNCNEAGGVVTCTIPSLPVTVAEDSVEIKVLLGGSPGDFISPSANVTATNDINPNNNSAQTQSFTIAGLVDFSIQKEAQTLLGVAQSNFAEGEDFQYVLTVKNETNESVDSLELNVIDDVPSGLTIGNFVAPAGWDCSLSNLPANHIECDNSTIFMANDTVNFIIPVSTTTAAQYINSADVDFFTFSSPLIELDFSNNTNDVTVNVGAQTSISVDVDALVLGVPVQSVSNGANFVYRVAVKNTGLFDANMIDFIDDMPSGVIVNGFNGAGWTCQNDGLSYFCDFPGPLAPGATTFVDFNVVESGSGSVLTNLVQAQALNAPLVNDFINTEVTNVSFDVSITQNPNPIEEDQPFDLIVDIFNTGTEAIVGAEVVNTLPEGFNYITQTKSSTCVVSGQDMTCTVDNPIAIGSTESVIFSIQAISTTDTTAVYTNTVTVSGVNVPAPIVVQSVTNVNPVGAGSGDFNYTISIVDSTDPNEVNAPFDYIVTLKNTGTSHITFIDVDVGIPSDLSINSMLTDGFICNSASFGLACNSDQSLDIAPGESKEIITVNVQSNGFVGEVIADVMANLGTLLQRTDDESTTIINTQVMVDVSVEIAAGDAIDQGAVSEFEVKIANSGPDVAEDVALNMSMTGILDSISVTPGTAWTCQVTNFNIDCQFNQETMPVDHHSSIFVTANTSQVVLDAEDLILSATITTSSEDSDLSNNSDSSQVGVTGTPTEGDIGEAIRAALGSTGNPQVDSAIEGISGFCEIAFYSAIEGLCSDLYDAALAGEVETVRTAIEQIMPNEVIGQSTSVSEIATAQIRNIGARLSQVRGGGGSGFSSAGLNARYGNGNIPLGMLAYLNQTEEETNGIDTNNDFISPWGFFINGTISMGERDATSRELAFDFDTFGITAGVDYRLDAKKVIGVALGYAKFDSTIEDVSELNSSGVTLTGYGSFYVTDNFYVDSRISYARPDFDQSRNIDFTLGSTHIDRTAVGETNADQYSFAMSAGYSFYKNAWNITPNASITYVKTTIDEFTETGAGDFNFVYLEQELESLVWSAGIRVSKAISLKNGVITPQFDFDYNYEGLNDGNDIQARFVSAPDDQLLIVVTDTPDRSYGSAGLGLVFISANGKQAYINYRSVIGLEGFSRGTFNIGARFEF